MKEAVWAAMLQLKIGDKQDRSDLLLSEQHRQHGTKGSQSQQTAWQSSVQTVEEADMNDGQATPEKQQDERRKRSKENTP